MPKPRRKLSIRKKLVMSEREKEVAGLIKKFTDANNGFSPSIRDLAKELNTSTSMVSSYLIRMEMDELIYPRPIGMARSIRLTPKMLEQMENS